MSSLHGEDSKIAKTIIKLMRIIVILICIIILNGVLPLLAHANAIRGDAMRGRSCPSDRGGEAIWGIEKNHAQPYQDSISLPAPACLTMLDS